MQTLLTSLAFFQARCLGREAETRASAFMAMGTNLTGRLGEVRSLIDPLLIVITIAGQGTCVKGQKARTAAKFGDWIGATTPKRWREALKLSTESVQATPACMFAIYGSMQQTTEALKEGALATLQRQVAEAGAMLPLQATCCSAPHLILLETRKVRCFCLTFCGDVEVNVFQCKQDGCHVHHAVHPSIIGFQRTTATVFSQTWISMPLLRFFRQLQVKAGVAANGEA